MKQEPHDSRRLPHRREMFHFLVSSVQTTGEIDATGIVVVTVAATTGIVVILIGYQGEGAVRSGDGVGVFFGTAAHSSLREWLGNRVISVVISKGSMNLVIRGTVIPMTIMKMPSKRALLE